MSCSTRLGAVADERAAGAAELVVERDAGGECQEALADAGSEAVQGAGAVAFEGQEVFERPEDRLDALSNRGEVWAAAGLVFAARADDDRVAVEHLGGEVAAGIALVADHDQRSGALAAVDEIQADIAFVDLGAGECDRAWGAIEREQPVQPEAPKEAAVAAAVPVVGGVGELAAADGFHRASALDRGGVDDQQVVIEARAHPRELAYQRLDHLGEALAALPVAGSLWQLREQVRE